MSYSLIVKEAAHLDVTAAYAYYEQQQGGIGERFLEALFARYYDLSEHPDYYSYIAQDPKQVLRKVRLKDFPYLVVYEISGAQVIIHAVHNTYQHPDKKHNR